MAREKYTNAQTTTLNGSHNNSTTSIVVNDGSTFPSAYFRILVESEIMFCTSRSSDTLTVIRGQEGTTAASHGNGVQCDHILTAGVLDALRRDILGDIGIIDTSTSLSVDDDDFDDENFSGWTTVQTTPNSTFTESNHRLSILMPGSQATAQITGVVKAKVPSAGDWIQTGVIWGGNVANYPLYGLVISNGATYGSGHQVFLLWSQQEKLFYISPWDGWNANGGTGTALSTDYPKCSMALHFRLVWQSNDHYDGYISPDGISWAKCWNNLNIGSVGTPTHMGMMMSSWDSASKAVASFSYCRFSF